MSSVSSVEFDRTSPVYAPKVEHHSIQLNLLALHAKSFLHCIIVWVFRRKFLIAYVRAFTTPHEHKIMVLDLLRLSANSKHNLTTEGSPRAFCVVCTME